MSKKKITIAKNTRFEDAMEELEGVVKTLESGDQALDQSLESFERGIALARFCQQSLSDADKKVQILIQEKGGELLSTLSEAEQ
jgi:exodeoxyribonuclease VII small subunit